MTPDDRDLRRAFGELRDMEAAQAPGFQGLPQVPRRPPRWPLPAALAVAVAVAAVLVPLQTARRAPPLDLAHGVEPTAFLLRTPGADLLWSAPAIGGGLPGHPVARQPDPQ